jgi:hypothetical protein
MDAAPPLTVERSRVFAHRSVVRDGRSGISPFASGRRRGAYSADELGSGGRLKRAGRNEGCERQHVGHESPPAKFAAYVPAVSTFAMNSNRPPYRGAVRF